SFFIQSLFLFIMKHNYVSMVAMAATMAAATLTFSGCGASKEWAATNPVEEYQQADPARRAYGKGQHFKEMTARNVAEAQARAQFARAIATKVTSASTENSVSRELFSADATSGNTATYQAAVVNDRVSAIAQEVIANAVVVKSLKKQLPNKEWEYWICVEYNGSVADLATVFAKKVEQRISNEDKTRMDYDFDKYRKEVEAALEKK
ncbi:MAG: hypothetical protein LBT04_05980, partial [Prevotellaceae bacterium]|nr:hypothetical protein [Prevotellaceae bacterium]